MSYTKGEWTIINKKKTFSGNIEVREAVDEFGTTYVADCGDHKKSEVNARLIVAAPDLLAACKAALEYLTLSSKLDWDNILTPQLEAAIAKAQPK